MKKTKKLPKAVNDYYTAQENFLKGKISKEQFRRALTRYLKIKVPRTY